MIVNSKYNLWSKISGLLRQSLFTNASYLFASEAITSLIGFAFWAIAARLYSPEDVGLATAILSATALMSSLAGMGMGVGLVRFLPQSTIPNRLLNTTFTFCTLTGALIGSTYLLGLNLWSPTLVILQENGFYATGFVLYVAAAALGSALKLAYVAHRRAGYSLAYMGVVNVGRLLLVSVLTFGGAVGLVVSAEIAHLLAIGIGLWGFLPHVRPGYRPHFDLNWTEIRMTVPYSIGNYISSLLTQTTQTILPLMVLEMLGEAASGYVYIALMVGSLLASPGAALSGSAFAEGSHSPQKLNSILFRAMIVSFAITIPAALIMGLTAPWLLYLFGHNYTQAGTGLLRWLAISAPLTVFTHIQFTYLRVQKKVGQLIVISGLFAITSLGIAAFLMPIWGLEGCGLGVVAGNGVVTLIFLVTFLHNKLSFRTHSGDPKS